MSPLVTAGRQWLHDLELEDAALAALKERASMNTDARRKASAAFHAKREEAGLKKVTLWLSDEARAALDRLKSEHGSKDKAAEVAILSLATTPAVKPSKAVSAPSGGSVGPVRPKPGALLKKR